jgi:hypothetical protein
VRTISLIISKCEIYDIAKNKLWGNLATQGISDTNPRNYGLVGCSWAHEPSGSTQGQRPTTGLPPLEEMRGEINESVWFRNDVYLPLRDQNQDGMGWLNFVLPG